MQPQAYILTAGSIVEQREGGAGLKSAKPFTHKNRYSYTMKERSLSKSVSLLTDCTQTFINVDFVCVHAHAEVCAFAVCSCLHLCIF